jgi:hypothetical protein
MDLGVNLDGLTFVTEEMKQRGPLGSWGCWRSRAIHRLPFPEATAWFNFQTMEASAQCGLVFLLHVDSLSYSLQTRIENAGLQVRNQVTSTAQVILLTPRLGLGSVNPGEKWT